MATCFICFKPVEEVGSGSSTNNGEGVASPGTYSLQNICRHLKLDMEMVRLLINHGEEDEAQQSGHDDPIPAKGISPDLKVTLCQTCGVVVTRFSELSGKQELIQMEMGSCMGVVGGLLAEADKDGPLIQQFHQRMTANISSMSFLCLRAMRREMAVKCGYKVSTGTEEIGRVAREPLGNSGSGAEPIAAGQVPHGSGSRKKLQRKGPSPMPGSGRTIQACASIGGIPASPPLPPNPSPPRSLLCNQCGTTFKFPETLQAHLKIVHGLVLIQEEPSQPPVAASRPKAVNGKRFESSQIQRYVPRAHGGFKSRVNAASTSTTSVQDPGQYQIPQPNGNMIYPEPLTMTLVAPAPVDDDDDDDAQDNVSIFEADPNPTTWDTFSPGLLDTSDHPTGSSSSGYVILRPNSGSSSGTDTHMNPVQKPRISKRGPMQLVKLAPTLPKGKGGRGRKPKSGTVAAACPHPPLPPNPAPRRSLLCNQCGATFKFPETLQAHLEIVHGLIRVQEEPSHPLVIPSSPKTVKYQFGKGRFESSLRLQRNVQRGAHGGFKSRAYAASTSTTSVQDPDQYQLQQQPNCADLSGAEADDDVVEVVDITDIDDELTVVAPAPVDDDDDAQKDTVSVFEADPAPWDTFSPGLLDTSDPSEESTSSSVVIPRPNSESSTGTEKDPPRIPKTGPMPMPQPMKIAPKLPKPGRGTRQLIKIAPKLPEPGREGQQLTKIVLKLPKGNFRGPKPKSGTDAEYVFDPQTGRFDCPRCSKNFRTTDICQNHFRNIHLKIRYTCEQCGKTFNSKKSRKSHLQVQHLGIRVKCELCDATFSYPSDLSSHRQSVHFGKLYACKHCSRSFVTSGARSSGHQRRCKGKITPCHD